MTTLREAIDKCESVAIESGAHESYKACRDAFADLRTALAQQELPQKERPDFMAGYDAGMADAKRMAQQGQPVCAGCGIPAGDVHMSTCKSRKWPSRVSNGDTAAPAPQTPFNEPDAAMWLTKNKLAQHDLLSAPQPNIQNQIVKDISNKPCHK